MTHVTPPSCTLMASHLLLLPSPSPPLPCRQQWLRCAPCPIITSARCSPRPVLSGPLVVSPEQRRSANYPPTLWNNDYLQTLRSDFDGVEYTVRFEKLKSEAKNLIARTTTVVKQLELVDTLRQLGLAYHFEEEIMDVLANISQSADLDSVARQPDGLHATALLFRLLREHGFDVSQDIFRWFHEETTGRFKDCITHDIKGLLSLYEASYVSMEEENIMDVAREFTTKHLKGYAQDSTEPWLRERALHALELPLNRRFQRLHSRWFIDMYERGTDTNLCLLELAKLDFNIVQGVYKTEIRQLSKWWADLNLVGDKLSFARDRLVENYLWAAGWSPEPKFSRCREASTKCNCFITAIDDIYDVYGTLEELELFTKAVERWEVSAIEKLPDYMKICVLALFNTFNDIAYKILQEKGLDIIPFIRKAWSDLCNAYLVEAKWYYKGYSPPLGQYLDNAGISLGEHVILTVAFFVSDYLSVESLERFKAYKSLMHWSGIIFRLYDDLATSKAEVERGDVSKAIQCYMCETGSSAVMARMFIRDMIADKWKILNKDRKANTKHEKYFKSAVINTLQTAQWFYQHGDGYGEPQHRTKDTIVALLLEPILL